MVCIRLFSLIAVLSLLAACAPAVTATQAPAAATTKAPAVVAPAATKKPYNIAVVVKVTGIPWFNAVEAGVKKSAKELGVNAYQIGPAAADPAQQVKVIEDTITTNPDALIVIPNDAQSVEPALVKAKDKGILILTHESPDQVSTQYDLALIDNTEFGKALFDQLVKYMGDSGEYAIFVGSLTVPLHNLWADVGIAYFKEKYPNMKLVTERIPAAEDQALSRQKTLDLIKAYPNLKGIIGIGTLGPIGAAQAVQEKGLSGKIAVVGTVLPSQAIPYLKDGSLKEGLLWNPADSGYALVWMAKYLLDGNKLVTGTVIPGLGAVTVNGKIVKLNAPLFITKENAESLGF